MGKEGIITSVQPMSIHDGPGIRTTVFLKGCNMRCKWCHNPETWSQEFQIQYVRQKCICCATCLSICHQHAISVSLKQEWQLNRRKCDCCGQCVDECPTGALQIVGRKVLAEELFNEIKGDAPFWEKSGGGVTISGGEPFLQPDFVDDLLQICHNNKISTAVETNLLHDWKRLSGFLSLVDYWFCDLKLANPQRHKYWTGVSNEIIIENINLLSRAGACLKVRTPIIPGVNDTAKDVSEICNILKPYASQIRYELLGFHTFGFEKYKSFDMNNEISDKENLDETLLVELKRIPLEFGLLP